MKKKIKMMKWAKELFPICRSLTGKGNVKTLNFFKQINKDFKIKYFRSGVEYYDWKIPLEWNINDAYIQDEDGKRFCEFKKNNLPRDYLDWKLIKNMCCGMCCGIFNYELVYASLSFPYQHIWTEIYF